MQMQQRSSAAALEPATSFTNGTDELVAPPKRRSSAPPPPRKSHPVRNAIIILVILALVGGAVMRILQTRKEAAAKQAAGGKGGGGFPVPVVAGTVQAKDVPIYLDGLGTIQALNTVTVRARVDGELKSIMFAEGQDVKKGDQLALIDPDPFQATLDQALAKQRQDEVQYENAMTDLGRDKELIEKKVISPQQLDYQQAQASQFEALVKSDAAAVANARVQLGYTKIASPLDARVGIRLVDQGNIVHAGDATGIVVLTQLQPISLIFTLPEQTLAQIHAEQKTSGPELEVVAVDRDNKTTLAKGKLTVIDNQIDVATGTIRLKAEFPNTDYSLWPGQFVNARLLASVRKGGLVVPASVIQRGPEGSFAYVIKPDLSVEMRNVKVAQIENGEALLADDSLKLGEQVVVDGQYKLQPGSHVRLGDAPGHAGGANPAGHAAPQPASAKPAK